MPPHIPKSTANHLKKITVMVADNDRDNLALLVKVLTYLGFRNVIGVQDGFKAVEAMRENDIDLIITDWELEALADKYGLNLPANPLVRSEAWSPTPPKDGFCLAQYLRLSKYSPNPYIAIIMLAGIGLRDTVERARDCGVNEILLKPLLVENLCDRIAQIIDAPRPFVTSKNYKGPCRRKRTETAYTGTERRTHDIIIFKHTG